MKERPILFSGDMVRALLSGAKTQTRRIVKPQPVYAGGAWKCADGSTHQASRQSKSLLESCPYGQPGERLWVKEDWRIEGKHTDSYLPDEIECNRSHFSRPAYEASITWNKDMYGKLRSLSTMPQSFSRILLEIVSIRVERLNGISEQDARAEGITDGGCVCCGNPEPCGCANPSPDARDAYIWLWESIYGAGSWAANPWVWVVEFKRILP